MPVTLDQITPGDRIARSDEMAGPYVIDSVDDRFVHAHRLLDPTSRARIPLRATLVLYDIVGEDYNSHLEPGTPAERTEEEMNQETKTEESPAIGLAGEQDYDPFAVPGGEQDGPPEDELLNTEGEPPDDWVDPDAEEPTPPGRWVEIPNPRLLVAGDRVMWVDDDGPGEGVIEHILPRHRVETGKYEDRANMHIRLEDGRDATVFRDEAEWHRWESVAPEQEGIVEQSASEEGVEESAEGHAAVPGGPVLGTDGKPTPAELASAVGQVERDGVQGDERSEPQAEEAVATSRFNRIPITMPWGGAVYTRDTSDGRREYLFVSRGLGDGSYYIAVHKSLTGGMHRIKSIKEGSHEEVQAALDAYAPKHNASPAVRYQDQGVPEFLMDGGWRAEAKQNEAGKEESTETQEENVQRRPRQQEMETIVKEVDGNDLTDIQLVEKILRLRCDREIAAGAFKRASEELVKRLQRRGETEADIGEHKVTIGPKCLTEYDQNTLGSLKACVTEDQLWITMKQVPSGKQLKALSDLGGASAKSVIASAKRKIETDTITVKIKKPKKHSGRGRGRRRF